MNVEREAELYIFAKSNEDTTHISKVRAVESLTELDVLMYGCLDDFSNVGQIYTKEEIVRLLNDDAVIYAAYYDSKSLKWGEGNMVETYADVFIRSNRDSLEEDNLGEICDFEIE